MVFLQLLCHSTCSVIADETAIEHFKRFVSSPPPIAELIYERKVGEGTTFVHTPTRGLETSKTYQRFVGRWQSNCWSLYSISLSGKGASPVINNISALFAEGTAWRMTSDGNLIQWHTNDVQTAGSG